MQHRDRWGSDDSIHANTNTVNLPTLKMVSLKVYFLNALHVCYSCLFSAISYCFLLLSTGCSWYIFNKDLHWRYVFRIHPTLYTCFDESPFIIEKSFFIVKLEQVKVEGVSQIYRYFLCKKTNFRIKNCLINLEGVRAIIWCYSIYIGVLQSMLRFLKFRFFGIIRVQTAKIIIFMIFGLWSPKNGKKSKLR